MSQPQQHQKSSSTSETKKPKSKEQPLLLGVYGTLKKGHSNHVYLTHHGTSKFIGDAVLAHCFMVSFGGFPACAIKKGSGSVKLEIFEVDEDTLALVDSLEGHPRWYKREKVKTPYGEAWVYFMPAEKLSTGKYPMVTSGNWPLTRG